MADTAPLGIRAIRKGAVGITLAVSAPSAQLNCEEDVSMDVQSTLDELSARAPQPRADGITKTIGRYSWKTMRAGSSWVLIAGMGVTSYLLFRVLARLDMIYAVLNGSCP